LGEGALDVSYGVGEEKDDAATVDGSAPPPPRLTWAQLAEITKCLVLRDKLPPSITQEQQEQISQYTAWRWFESLRHPRLAFLAMNSMLTRILVDMHHHETEPPVIVYSAHDSTLIGLLCALRLEKPKDWPEYASYIKMELLEVTNKKMPTAANNDKDMEAELVVRFSLNGQLLHSIWNPDKPPMAEIPLKMLAHRVKTEGSVHAS